jgi:hypothetical protein
LYTCTDACIEKYYILPKTPKIKSEGGVDIDDVNVEQRKNNSKRIETIVERISVKTKKAKYKNIGEVMQQQNITISIHYQTI